MRASRSCPRSSVPNGCANEGASRRAAKSMSLTATPQNRGANTIAATITIRMPALSTAMRWRRKRRHASSHGENGRAGRCGNATNSAECDAGIEPSIKYVRDEIEQHDEAGEHEGHRHDDRRIIGKDRADDQRTDARDAEDLLGDD